MTLQDEIITWVDKRPKWQQAIMARVVRGQTIDETFIETIVDSLVSTSTLASFSPLIADDLPISNDQSEAVSLTSIQNLKNVNALQQDQVLNFGVDGITIIYGDNGSGKSGYARLIKSAVGARHLENVLPDAFSATAGKDQSAEISFPWGPIPRPKSGQSTTTLIYEAFISMTKLAVTTTSPVIRRLSIVLRS